MLMPSIFGENLFDDFFGDLDREMQHMDRRLYGKNAAREMKTDVREHDDRYEINIDLPGFKKDEVTLELDNGYLTVTAAKGLEEEKSPPGVHGNNLMVTTCNDLRRHTPPAKIVPKGTITAGARYSARVKGGKSYVDAEYLW